MTTNGLLLAEKAAALKAAGLRRVNISLDTLKPERYRWITRGGKLARAWRGIEAALELDLQPVKLNTVVVRGFNDDEVIALAALSLERPLHVRFIELMPVGTADGWASERYISSGELMDLIARRLGRLQEVRKLSGSGPARYYRLDGAAGTIGFISAVSDHFCARCNRLRLTATGGLRPCLFDQREIDIKAALRRGAGPDELAGLIERAVHEKPDRHHMVDGWHDRNRIMSQIGG